VTALCLIGLMSMCEIKHYVVRNGEMVEVE